MAYLYVIGDPNLFITPHLFLEYLELNNMFFPSSLEELISQYLQMSAVYRYIFDYTMT